jgi:drug/metabolite transporter (DMT)-like permease
MLINAFAWGANIVAGKEALRGINPLALAEVRAGGTGILCVVLIAVLRGRPGLRRLFRAQWRSLLLVALFGITLNQIGFIGGLSRTSPDHAALVVAVTPALVLALSCLMRLEAFTALKTTGVALAFSGVALLAGTKAGGPNQPHLSGDLMMFAGCIMAAYYTILLKQRADVLDALSLTAIIFLEGAVMLLPVSALPLLHMNWRAVSMPAWWGLAFMIVVASVIAYTIYAFALTELTATRVAAFGYLQPIVATALGIWLLGERLTLRVVISGILILLGVHLTERERGETAGARGPEPWLDESRPYPETESAAR